MIVTVIRDQFWKRYSPPEICHRNTPRSAVSHLRGLRRHEASRALRL